MDNQNRHIGSMPDISKIDILILCGGLGERLRSVIGESQKVMAKVSGQPFLDLLLNDLVRQGVKRVILLTGYKAATLEDYYRTKKFPLQIEFSPELSPLGTGGAVRNAQRLIQSDPFIVMNGDSFCPSSYQEFLQYHMKHKAMGSIVVTQLENRSDFGTIALDGKNRIIRFQEKVKDDNWRSTKKAKTFVRLDRTKKRLFVNAGIYCFMKEIFDFIPHQAQFSLEKDFFPTILEKKFFGFVSARPLTDIGTPQRYQDAQTELNSYFFIELPSIKQNSKSPGSVQDANGRFGVEKEKLNKKET